MYVPRRKLKTFVAFQGVQEKVLTDTESNSFWSGLCNFPELKKVGKKKHNMSSLNVIDHLTFKLV